MMSNDRYIFLSVLIVLVVLSSGTGTTAAEKTIAAPDAPDRKVFQNFANKIIAGVTNSTSSRLPKSRIELAIKYFEQTYASVSGKNQRIALWPFRAKNIPIAKTVADGFNDQLMAELLNSERGPYEFVARDALKPLIADLYETGALDGEDDPIAALMSRARNIDILIQGRMRLAEGGVTLGYKAVRMDGTIVAQTNRIVIPLKAYDKTASDNLLTLDQTVSQAATHFAEALADLDLAY